MIDIINQVVEIISNIDGLNGKVYRRWPKKKTGCPAVLVSHSGHYPALTDADGQSIMSNLIYSIDINADNPKQCDELTAKIVDALECYNFHANGMTDFYDDVLQVYRSIITVNGVVDVRGNTFTI